MEIIMINVGTVRTTSVNWLLGSFLVCGYVNAFIIPLKAHLASRRRRQKCHNCNESLHFIKFLNVYFNQLHLYSHRTVQ